MGFQRGESVYTQPVPAVELWSPEKRILAMHTDPAPGGAWTPGIVFENLQAFSGELGTNRGSRRILGRTQREKKLW